MEGKSLIKLFSIAGGIVLAIWIIFGGLSEACKKDGKNVESITALFSGLAFAGMIVAIVLQSKELSLQRQELVETRRELKRTAEANEKSAELSQENLIQQAKIAEIQINYTRNQILAQKYIAEINDLYKKMELFKGPHYIMRNKEYMARINLLLEEIQQLNTFDVSINRSPPSTPEA